MYVHTHTHIYIEQYLVKNLNIPSKGLQFKHSRNIQVHENHRAKIWFYQFAQ